MNLLDVMKKDLILLDLEATSKEEVIRELIELIAKEGVLESKEEFYRAVMAREKLSPTGLEEGLATPHGKSKVVKRPVVAMAKLKTPIKEWESIDEANEVDTVFLLGIPESEAGTTHIEILTKLTTLFIDDEFVKSLKNTKSKEEIVELLKKYSQSEKENSNESENKTSQEKIVICVTACATGIAHTFMAAEALEKAGRKLGITVYTEKQGASGIEGRFSKELIEKADAVVFATDVAVKEKGRFNGKNYIQTRVAEPLKKAEEILEKALNNPQGKVKEEENSSENNEKKSFLSEVSSAILTGISYMIPVIVAGGLMMGLPKLLALPFGDIDIFGSAKYLELHSGEFFKLLVQVDKFGGFIYKFIYPIFAAYLAFSISDKSGLVPGFIGGAFAGGLHFTFWNIPGIPSGFFGAVILGLIAGYVTRWANEKINLPKNLKALKPMLIVPAIGAIAIFISNLYFVDPIFGGLNALLQNLIKQHESSKFLLSTLIAGFTAFDLGGPVNKAAGAIAIGLASDNIFPLTPRVLSIVIPPIGLGVATLIDKFLVGRRVFDEELKVVGESSLLLGFIAISEGAIPFMLKNPVITIPINILGAIIGSLVAVGLGAEQWLPLPAIWGWPLIKTGLPQYLLGMAVGVLFIAITNVYVRYYIMKKEESK